MKRTQIPKKEIEQGIEDFKESLMLRLREKGYGSFASIHEILGVVQEEVKELIDAVHQNDHQTIEKELIDIAVGCVFAAICVNSGTLDW